MSSSISIPKVDQYGMSDLQNAINQEAASNERLLNDGFFPDIELVAVRNAMRVDGTVTNDRLKMAVLEAMASVNQDLILLKKQAIEQGKSFANVQSAQLNGESLNVQRYKRAVYCLAVANLYERYRAYDIGKEGVEKADSYENSVDDLRRDARFAIRDILGKTRINAELI